MALGVSAHPDLLPGPEVAALDLAVKPLSISLFLDQKFGRNFFLFRVFFGSSLSLLFFGGFPGLRPPLFRFRNPVSGFKFPVAGTGFRILPVPGFWFEFPVTRTHFRFPGSGFRPVRSSFDAGFAEFEDGVARHREKIDRTFSVKFRFRRNRDGFVLILFVENYETLSTSSK